MRLAAQDEPRPRSPQRLVRRAGDKVGDWHRAVVHPRRHQPRIVRHVDHEQRPDFTGNLGELRVVDLARVRARPSHNQLRLVLAGQRDHLVEVDPMIGRPDPVMHRPVQLPREIQVHAVRQVPAMGQVLRQERIARLQHREIDRHVRRRTRVRLHVGVLGPEQGPGPRPGQIFDHVDVLASAVVPATGVALGVLVGQHRPGGGEHRGAGVVLGGDQLETIPLTAGFVFDSRPQLGIGGFKNRHVVQWERRNRCPPDGRTNNLATDRRRRPPRWQSSPTVSRPQAERTPAGGKKPAGGTHPRRNPP